jgi:hypothetical protein
LFLTVISRESYGEDVGQSDTDEELASGDDSYESDFIDDHKVIPEESHGSDSIEEGERIHVNKDCLVSSPLFTRFLRRRIGDKMNRGSSASWTPY